METANAEQAALIDIDLNHLQHVVTGIAARAQSTETIAAAEGCCCLWDVRRDAPAIIVTFGKNDGGDFAEVINWAIECAHNYRSKVWSDIGVAARDERYPGIIQCGNWLISVAGIGLEQQRAIAAVVARECLDMSDAEINRALVNCGREVYDTISAPLEGPEEE
jgi:hypothetical protein